MTKKVLFASFLLILLTTSFGSVLFAVDYAGQEKKETELAPKYTAFLAEVQPLMTAAEKEVFLSLENDRERDFFIESFWQQRGGRQRAVRSAVRSNINMLRLVRMVQALDLTTDQVALIMPAMNKNEEEKKRLQEDLQLNMRDLSLLVRRDNPDEKKLNALLNTIRALRKNLQEKEAEFDQFLRGNLSIAQQAQYLIFSQEFYRGLQEQLNNARRTQQRLQQPIRKKRQREN